jgi:arginyl-tRNA synthetase
VTLIELQNLLKDNVRRAAVQRWGIELESLSAEAPKRPDLGDIAFPVAFELAKMIKQGAGIKLAPRSIAEEIKPLLEATEGVARVEVAGAGYINIFFDRARLFSDFSSQGMAEASPATNEARPKKMVEHTSINPNKAAHIGHCGRTRRGPELHRQHWRPGGRRRGWFHAHRGDDAS